MNKKKVLIVDDETNMADSLQDILEMEGYEAVTAYSGEEAIELAKMQEFDCFILDIKMPGINGVDVFQAIKKFQPGPRVIFMTGYSRSELIERAVEEGAIEVLIKPLDIPKLFRLIEKAKKGNNWGHKGFPILIVDDDKSFCESLEDLLEANSYQVETAQNPHKAISLIEKQSVDIVLLDMKLEAGNGIKTFYMIRKLNPTIIIILMTSYREEMKEKVEQMLKSSAYTCLYKPFDPRELLSTLKSAVKSRAKKL